MSLLSSDSYLMISTSFLSSSISLNESLLGYCSSSCFNCMSKSWCDCFDMIAFAGIIATGGSGSTPSNVSAFFVGVYSVYSLNDLSIYIASNLLSIVYFTSSYFSFSLPLCYLLSSFSSCYEH